jgi:hypothetical protein
LTVFNAQPSRRKHSSRPTPSSSSLCTAACRARVRSSTARTVAADDLRAGISIQHAVRWRLSVGQHIDSPVGDRVDDDGAARPSLCSSTACRTSVSRSAGRRDLGVGLLGEGLNLGHSYGQGFPPGPRKSPTPGRRCAPPAQPMRVAEPEGAGELRPGCCAAAAGRRSPPPSRWGPR